MTERSQHHCNALKPGYWGELPPRCGLMPNHFGKDHEGSNASSAFSKPTWIEGGDTWENLEQAEEVAA